jgi:sugar lactone lactonase YvrE
MLSAIKTSCPLALLFLFGLQTACTSLSAASGDLFVVDQGTSVGTGSIDVYTPGGVFSMLASNLYDPQCLAFDSSGNLFVGDGGTIYQYAPNGTSATFATGLQNPVSLAFDKAGNLFVSDHAAESIIKITSNDVQSTFATNLGNLYGLAFDGDGNLFASVGSSILKITPDGTESVFVSATEGINGGSLAFDRAGNLYATGSDASQAQIPAIVRFTPGGFRSVFATGFNNRPDSLAFDNSGNLFTTAGGASTNTIYKITPAGNVTVFATHATPYAEYLAFAGVTLPVPPPPSVSIANFGSGALLHFTGVLQESADLQQWQDVNPQPSNPWMFTTNTDKIFFRARSAGN